MFWSRKGEPIEDTIEWARLFEDVEVRVVACDQDGPGQPMVSTIWEGMDLGHSLTPGIPLIFETAYLVGDDSHADGRVEERWLSATEEEAIETHKAVCIEKLGRPARPEDGLVERIIELEKGQ